ncbi:type II secretion system protein GspD [Flagellimonas eckloniae]|uniref:General secretion pathway protein GspD n=1 Tax=Flagellimonas eckloniae TaxID=346185 RepID=A0A0Q0XE03_9FLAO|nr:general secretion pathway protein GspD [Allomuricauda eckloniae]KQC29391.1 general secretion pathway protein GspD [Allomuricauda eckloniae]
MKKNLLLIFLLYSIFFYGQEESRIQSIKNNLEVLSVDNPGLSENLKLDINVNSVSLSNFLLAVSQVHKININIDPGLQGINIVNNFSNVTVADLLVFLCKQYGLDINFTGNILSIQKFQSPPVVVPEKEVVVAFDALNNLISMDLNGDTLEKTFRKIIDISGQNLLYNNGMETIPLTLYLKNVPIDLAMEKLAETNNLKYSKSRDGFYLFDRVIQNNGSSGVANRGNRALGNNNFYYQVLDTVNRILNVDFDNVPIAAIVRDISLDLDLDVYVATPLTDAGNINFKAKQIYYDELLTKIFESKATSPNTGNANVSPRPQNPNRSQNRASQNPLPNTTTASFTFKKENDRYFFGTADQLSVRKLEVIQMMHRSVELLGDPMQSGGAGRTAGRTVSGGVNYLGNGFQNSSTGFNNTQGNFGQNSNSSRRISTQTNQFNDYSSPAEAIVNILPDDVVTDLDVKIDFELNSFLVSGPAANINRFKKFIKEIDKPVPVILIEVMLIEVRKSATVETGISWGIGEEAVTTTGNVFPETDLTLGASTVNKIIGGFDGFGSFNIGKVVPEFFATIKAMESNGNIKIRSTPKLSTLNGHRANLSIGETTYYVVTSQNFFGSQIPTASEIRNFQPIDAQLAVSIKPLVSGNGQVTLDINVIQSDFSSERIDDDAPPGLTSREFSSIIRMQNQDLAILGGLEEKVKNDSGSGVPFLARIPIIKWFFSKRIREDSKQKLTILIKPTVIY